MVPICLVEAFKGKIAREKKVFHGFYMTGVRDQGCKPGNSVRRMFPFFCQQPDVAYLDSAATTQKPSVVVDSLCESMSFINANVHRGAYSLSAQASERYEEARKDIAKFIGAVRSENIVFVKGATEGINLVARGYEHAIKEGEVILLSLLEHHSNIVPWQMLAKRCNASIEFVEIHQDGTLNVEDYREKVSRLKPRIIAVTQLANSIGTVTPIKELVEFGKAGGACVVVDGSQGVVHLGVDVDDLGCDFYVFSGHKIYGPTGVGVLYGRSESLALLDPLLGGGDMISYVTTEGFGLAEIPQRFEAGTPAFHEAIALGAAIRFLNQFSWEDIRLHEQHVMQNAYDMLQSQKDITTYGPGIKNGLQAGGISFDIKGVHPHDFATVADAHGVQIRAGNHCAMPTLRALGVSATVRASFGLYSSVEDIVRLESAIVAARKMFG